MARLKGQVQWIFMIYCWHLLSDIIKWINCLNFRGFFCNIVRYWKLVFVHLNFFFFCLWNKPPTALNWFIFLYLLSCICENNGLPFNITTDVLSYAYQLLFYTTFLFSTFAAFHHFVLLFWKVFPSMASDGSITSK